MKRVLDFSDGNIISVSDNDVFFSAADMQISIHIQIAKIAGVQSAFFVNGLFGGNFPQWRIGLGHFGFRLRR